MAQAPRPGASAPGQGGTQYPGDGSPKLVEQNSVQQSALVKQGSPSGGKQVALRQVLTKIPGKTSAGPHFPEQQSASMPQMASTLLQAFARQKPDSQIPVQHCAGLVHPTLIG
jgi:hypothetical protein